MKKAHHEDLKFKVESNETPEEQPVEAGEDIQDDVEILRGALATLAVEKEDLHQQLLRNMAEFQNFRRRSEEEKSQLRRYATQDLVVQLLPVLDNFERSLRSLDSGASVESVVEGVKMVDKQLRVTLESQNLVRIPSVGEMLDTDLHEAIATMDSDEHPEGTIVQELEAGYKMSDKVIRPARVKVAKKKAE